MGITKLNSVLKSYGEEEIFIEIDSKYFKGKTIAIDAQWKFTAIKSMLVKNEMQKYLDFKTGKYDPGVMRNKLYADAFYNYSLWLSRGITPLYVFDGPPPDAKLLTRNARISSRVKYQEKRDNMLEEMKKSKFIMTTEKELEFVKYCKYSVGFSRDESEGLIKFLQSIGAPCLVSTTEGEKLCCMLAKEKKYPVHSIDTDCIAYGAPLLITDAGVGTYKCVYYKNVLKQMELSRHKFLEFCVLLGCDYNKGVSLKKAEEIIYTYGGLDNYVKKFNQLGFDTKINVETINMKVSLELFKDVSSDEITDKVKSSQTHTVTAVDKKEVLKIMRKYGIDTKNTKFFDLVEKFQQ